MRTAETGIHEEGVVSTEPLRIYTGILGQIGDIIAFGPTVRRIKQLFPNSSITFAVSRKYREAGALLAGLPYVDRLFVTGLYFEKLTPPLFQPWERGWPVDFRGDDEVAEQRRHDLVLETRPRTRCQEWWKTLHQVEMFADAVGVPGPIDIVTEIAVPPGTLGPPTPNTEHPIPNTAGKIVLHNDPDIDPRKAWPWEYLTELVRLLGPGEAVLIGKTGPPVPGVLDLRGRTTLAETAAIIASARCFVGIESGPTVIAGALQAPTVGLFGTEYHPKPQSVQPVNPRARYLNADGALAQMEPREVLAALHEVCARSG